MCTCTLRYTYTPTDSATIEKLRRYGMSVLPALSTAKVVGTYSGLRPATEFRDYQISSDPAQNWITVGGIRSTGLTASSGIGEYVRRLYCDLLQNCAAPLVECARVGPPYSPAPLSPEPKLRNPKIPSLVDLAADFQRRGDGTVEVFGRVHRVTHPLSSLGMARTPPIRLLHQRRAS